MIIEQKEYDCPKCHQGYFIPTRDDTGNEKCKECNILLRYCGTFLVDTEKNQIVKQLHQAEPDESVKKFIEQSQPKSKPVVTCPYCKSTNVHKISGIGKAASIGLFGIFALPGATKQFHCRECKADF